MSREKAKHYLVHCLTELVLPSSMNNPFDAKLSLPPEFKEDIEQIVDLIMDGVKEEIKQERGK